MTDSALKRFASLPAGADRSDWAAVLRDGATMVGMFVRLPTPELAASAHDGSLAESAAAIVDELVRLGVGAMPASDWEGAFGTATLDGLRWPVCSIRSQEGRRPRRMPQSNSMKTMEAVGGARALRPSSRGRKRMPIA